MAHDWIPTLRKCTKCSPSPNATGKYTLANCSHISDSVDSVLVESNCRLIIWDETMLDFTEVVKVSFYVSSLVQ